MPVPDLKSLEKPILLCKTKNRKIAGIQKREFKYNAVKKL